MIGLLLGLLLFVPTAVWLVGVVGTPRWLVSLMLLAVAAGLHAATYRLQVRILAKRAPHLLQGRFLRPEVVDALPKWTTQFTGVEISVILTIVLVWIVQFF